MNRYFTEENIHVAKKHMERFSLSNENYDMIRLHTNENGWNEKDWAYWDLASTWSSWNSHSLLVEMSNVTTALEKSLEFLKKLDIHLISDPTILLTGVYSRERKAYTYRKTCTRTLTAALFVIVQNWKQPKCSSTSEWINKLWSIHRQNGIQQ